MQMRNSVASPVKTLANGPRQISTIRSDRATRVRIYKRVCIHSSRVCIYHFLTLFSPRSHSSYSHTANANNRLSFGSFGHSNEVNPDRTRALN